jgi:TRAP-type C4-dicarboxylate transport system permease small subunit
MVLVVWTVVARSLGGQGLRSVEEFVGSLTMFAVFVGLGYTYRVGGHVRTDILVRRLTGRWRGAFALGAGVVCLAFALVVFVASLLLWLDLLESGVMTPSGEVARWIPTTAMVLGSAWLLVEIGMSIVRLLLGIQNDISDDEIEPNI